MHDLYDADLDGPFPPAPQFGSRRMEPPRELSDDSEPGRTPFRLGPVFVVIFSVLGTFLRLSHQERRNPYEPRPQMRARSHGIETPAPGTFREPSHESSAWLTRSDAPLLILSAPPGEVPTDHDGQDMRTSLTLEEGTRVGVIDTHGAFATVRIESGPYRNYTVSVARRYLSARGSEPR